ncbi:outer membrane lipoprotein carrier protein LolA [Saliphagus sp. GCM10025334]
MGWTYDGLVLAAITLVVVCAGCTVAISGETQPDGETLLEEAVTSDDVPPLTGERTVTFADSAGTYETTERVWERPPSKMRTEVIDSSGFEESHEGGIAVRNGSTLWLTDGETDNVTTYDLESKSESESESESENEADDEARLLEERLDRYDVAYEGTETVANRTTHVVSVEPKETTVDRGIGVLVGDTRYVYPLETSAYEETDFEGGTFWIDDEHGYPLAMQGTYTDVDGTELEVTSTFETVTFGADLEDGLFDPPVENGTSDEESVEEPEFEQHEFEDRSEANEYLRFEVPNATFPTEYERQSVSADQWNGVQTYHEEYRVGEDLLWFSVSEGDLRDDDPDRENVGELEATVSAYNGTTLVTWDCGELTYQLSSSIDEAALLERAEEIGCQ